jgi:hypothetical protein
LPKNAGVNNECLMPNAGILAFSISHSALMGGLRLSAARSIQNA